FLAAWAGHLRALAERRGRELRGFGVDWGLALGTIAGTLLLRDHGALGPSVGLLAGLAVGTAMLWPGRGRTPKPAPREPENDAPAVTAPGDRRPLWLLLDALLYGNLGVVDSLFSHLLIAGSLAVLSYAGLFVNSALMLLTGAVTVVALRMAAATRGAHSGDGSGAPSMRRWSLLGGGAVTLGLLVIGLLLGWAPVVELFERLLGWDLAGSVRPVVLWSLPYAFLRLANTIGRQRRLVHGELRGVVAWDVAGIAARSIILALVIAELGLVAFPLAAAAAELLQLGVWWGEGRRASA
ncbi:MAG: hypothetical protein KC486_27475, partial [Myxococcales bacterium]|nr:hypothetical protein [Myxococcales bacterium]